MLASIQRYGPLRRRQSRASRALVSYRPLAHLKRGSPGSISLASTLQLASFTLLCAYPYSGAPLSRRLPRQEAIDAPKKQRPLHTKRKPPHLRGENQTSPGAESSSYFSLREVADVGAGEARAHRGARRAAHPQQGRGVIKRYYLYTDVGNMCTPPK